MNCKVLATRASVDRHTGVNLATEINDTMVEFGLERVSKLNNKSESKGSSVDVKNVMKFLVGTPEETDNIIKAFEAGAALFLTATHLTVARTLFRNCEEYANQIEASDTSRVEGHALSPFQKQISEAIIFKKHEQLLLSDSEESEKEEDDEGTGNREDMTVKGHKRKERTASPPPTVPKKKVNREL